METLNLLSVLSMALNLGAVALLVKNEHRFTKMETLLDLLATDYHDRRTHNRAER